MKFDETIIDRVSRLARIDLSDSEKTGFRGQITDIINYVEKINELDTEGVLPVDHIADLSNVTRKDEAGTSLKNSDLEKIAPEFANGHIVVPKIIDDHE